MYPLIVVIIIWQQSGTYTYKNFWKLCVRQRIITILSLSNVYYAG